MAMASASRRKHVKGVFVVRRTAKRVYHDFRLEPKGGRALERHSRRAAKRFKFLRAPTKTFGTDGVIGAAADQRSMNPWRRLLTSLLAAGPSFFRMFRMWTLSSGESLS